MAVLRRRTRWLNSLAAAGDAARKAPGWLRLEGCVALNSPGREPAKASGTDMPNISPRARAARWWACQGAWPLLFAAAGPVSAQVAEACGFKAPGVVLT